MKNIIDTIQANQDYSTLAEAIKAAGLMDTLSSEGPYTLLAPSNVAFAKISSTDLKNLLDDKTKLIAVLKHHLISGKVMSVDVAKISEVTPLAGEALSVSYTDQVMINDAKISKKDIECTNGVIHVIDTVLM